MGFGVLFFALIFHGLLSPLQADCQTLISALNQTELVHLRTWVARPYPIEEYYWSKVGESHFDQLMSKFLDKQILSTETRNEFKTLGGRFTVGFYKGNDQQPLLIFYVDLGDGRPSIRLNKKVIEDFDSLTTEDLSLLAHEFSHFKSILAKRTSTETLLQTWNRLVNAPDFLRQSEQDALISEYQYRARVAGRRGQSTPNSAMRGQLLLSTWTYAEASALRETLTLFENTRDPASRESLTTSIDELLTRGLRKVDFLRMKLRPRIEKRVAEIRQRPSAPMSADEQKELNSHLYSLWSLDQEPLDILFRGAGGIGAFTQLSSKQISFLRERVRHSTHAAEKSARSAGFLDSRQNP